MILRGFGQSAQSEPHIPIAHVKSKDFEFRPETGLTETTRGTSPLIQRDDSHSHAGNGGMTTFWSIPSVDNALMSVHAAINAVINSKAAPCCRWGLSSWFNGLPSYVSHHA
jgi:hypothetical protein